MLGDGDHGWGVLVGGLGEEREETGRRGVPKKEECVAMYVLSSICAKPPKAPTILSMIWNVACVLWLKLCVRLFGSLGSIPIPPMPPMP